MTHPERLITATVVIAGFALVVCPATGQTRHGRPRHFAPHVVMPQSRAWAPPGAQAARISKVDVGVVIVEQVAVTTMDISLINPVRSPMQAELIVPVPNGSVLRGFSFHGSATEPTAELLSVHEAASIYDSLVAKIRDPALMEFAGHCLVRTSVFPIAPNGTQKLRLTYEHLLPADGDRIDYVLPRSESLDVRVPWTVSVRIRSKRPVSTVYSPSHKLETIRSSPTVVSVRLAPGSAIEPGPFRLSYLLETNGVTASLLSYPDPSTDGGYFLLLAGLPVKAPNGDDVRLKREVTLVLDRSGSMRGEKLEQVREAALQVLAGLETGDYFNIITYARTVDLFAANPIRKTGQAIESARAYLKGINSKGGTNIHDALVESLRQKPAEHTIPLVLFLTDGLPTVGPTSEAAIRDVVKNSNPYKRRIFSFGVGLDVNTPLLERIALETRATAHFVLPAEDVEVKVAQVFKQLVGPVFTDPKLEVVGSTGEPAMGRLSDVIPGDLPDLFEDDQLVVLGCYCGTDPLRLRLTGNYFGRTRSFEFTFPVDNATTKNGFVRRLWASRKIAVLIDAIREMGGEAAARTVARSAHSGPVHATAGALDPKLKELVDEIVLLSTEHGILTEYTAFLALEGTDLSRRDDVLAEARGNFVNRAMRIRSGLGSVNQSYNNQGQIRQSQLNRDNSYWDENMNRVSITNVQQVSDLAFFNRGGRWVDSRIVNEERDIEPSAIIEFGSEQFRALARRLVREGRQGTISLRGDILMLVDDKPVLIKGPAALEGVN
ncbi:MAG: VWA domain-containing protein [Planctomycetota bacterium]|nr:VWA domain-containing protein [Planctomycetota bacterium]